MQAHRLIKHFQNHSKLNFHLLALSFLFLVILLVLRILLDWLLVQLFANFIHLCFHHDLNCDSNISRSIKSLSNCPLWFLRFPCEFDYNLFYSYNDLILIRFLNIAVNKWGAAWRTWEKHATDYKRKTAMWVNLHCLPMKVLLSSLLFIWYHTKMPCSLIFAAI